MPDPNWNKLDTELDPVQPGITDPDYDEHPGEGFVSPTNPEGF